MSETWSVGIEKGHVDLVADVLLWEMWRAGDWEDWMIAEARAVATVIIEAQRRGSYPHRIIERLNGPAAGGEEKP